MAERSEAVEQQAVRDGSAVYSVERGIATAEDVPPGYKRTEAGVIPDDWQIESVSEFGKIVTGGTPSTLIREYWNGTYPWVTPTDISQKRDVYSTDRLLTTSGLNAIRELPSNSVLITCIASIGKNAVLRVPGGCNQQINAVIPNRQHSAEYLYYKFEAAKDYLLGNAGTTATAILSKARFQELVFSIPPITEQRAIATALSDADALIESLDRLTAKKRAIKQAAMQQLLTGQTRLPGFTGKWETKRLGEVAEIDPENLGANTPGNYAFSYISLEQVEEGTLLGWSTEKFRTAPSRARRVLREEDILVSTVRPNLKSHLKFGGQFPKAVCSTGFAVVRCAQGLADPGYIYAHFFGSLINRQIDRIIAGSNYPAISSSDVRRFEVPLPCLEEQAAIATVLSDMDTEIEALERRRDKARQIKQGMMQQLLTGRVRLIEENREDAWHD